MEVIIQPTAERAVDLVARLVAKQLRDNPHSVLGLATGRTMEAVYERLVRMHKEEKLDFSLCRTFNLDEYVGLSPESPHSYRFYMNRHLFGRVNIDPRNTHLPDGAAPNLEAACRKYEEIIREFGGIDLQLLGIGASGHIGFNEPLSSLSSRTREKALVRSTLDINGSLFGKDVGSMPTRALTMGVGTILEAERIILLATGPDKGEILAKAVEGPITSMVSATALQLHRRCRVIVDEASAQKLQGKDYYRWCFENEPEWAPYR